MRNLGVLRDMIASLGRRVGVGAAGLVCALIIVVTGGEAAAQSQTVQPNSAPGAAAVGQPAPSGRAPSNVAAEGGAAEGGAAQGNAGQPVVSPPGNSTGANQAAGSAPPAGAPAPVSGDAAPAANQRQTDGAPTANGEAGQPDTKLFPAEMRQAVARQRGEVERLSKSVERVKNDDAAIERLRPEIEEIISKATANGEALKPLLATVERQIKALGPAPKEGETAETPALAAERQRLERVKSELQDAIKQSELTTVRAKQLLDRIHSLRLENLGRDLRERQVNPVEEKFWDDLYAALPRLGTQISTVADNWWTGIGARLEWLLLIVPVMLAVWLGLRALARRQLRLWLRQPLVEGRPAYLKRVRMAIRTLPLVIAPGLLTLGAVYLVISSAGLLNEQLRVITLSGVVALALFLLISGLARAILLPMDPAWRLIGLTTGRAQQYTWLISLLAGVYCFDIWLNDVFQALVVPIPVKLGQTLIANLVFAVLLFAFVWVPTTFDSDRASHRASARLLHKTLAWLRLPATLIVLAIIVVSLMGYLTLGRFLAGQVMLIGIGAAVLLLGHLAARSVARYGSGPGETAGTTQTLLSGERRSILFHTVAFVLDAVFLVMAVAALLISWGYSYAELFGWGRALLFGFEVGQFRFSLVQILLAGGLFAGLIFLTRLFQRWLNRNVLTTERVDRGIANSIHAGVGYLGIAVAALIGVSYAGIDLSNIALIASALSIGIGFGLNAIASNFVSGLIMLIERPIKVGDWVVVGNYEGFVRHISVRATEIETFDRASVIVPNSDFMTGAVQNWTHRNAMGRVVVNIGVAYSSDLDQVMELFQKVANDCEELLNYPAPFVVFENFGASSLDFSVRGYVADVTKSLSARTALRLALAKALREAGIEVPFPQQDVHFRDLDGVRQMLKQAVAQRTGGAGADAATIEPEPEAKAGEQPQAGDDWRGAPLKS